MNVKTCPVEEAMSKKLSGIAAVNVDVRGKMIKAAVKAGAEVLRETELDRALAGSVAAGKAIRRDDKRLDAIREEVRLAFLVSPGPLREELLNAILSRELSRAYNEGSDRGFAAGRWL
jgi:hypothetical protein